METAYKPEVCDLCHSKKCSVLLELKNERAMRSDRRIVNCNLEKYVCDNCGLVRGGRSSSNQRLEDYYSDEYRLSEQTDEYLSSGKRTPLSQGATIMAPLRGPTTFQPKSIGKAS
jgi:hypothetical protein